MKKTNGQPPRTRNPQRPRAQQRQQQWEVASPRGAPRRPALPRMPAPAQVVPPDAMGGVDAMPLDMMGPDESARVEQFLADAYSVGPVAELVLYQVAGGTQTMIRDWTQMDLAEVQDAAGLAGEIVAVATEDAEHAGLPVGRYVICATKQPGGPPHRRCFFTVQGPVWDGATAYDQYAGESGVQMQMRHNEAILRLALGGQSAVARSLITMNHELMHDAREARRLGLDAVKLREELLDRGQERSLAMRKQSLAMERGERAWQRGEQLLWFYMPHLLGRAGLPVPPAGIMGGNGTGAATSASAAKPIDLTDAEVATLGKVTIYVLDALAGMDPGQFELTLARVPEGARLDVRAAREHARARKDAGADAPPITDTDKVMLINFRSHVIQLLSSLSDLEVAMLLDKLPESVRGDLVSMRAVVRAKLTKPAAPALTNGVPAASSVVSTPANGPGTNGAPAAGGTTP